MSDAPVLPYWQIFLDHSFGSFVGFSKSYCLPLASALFTSPFPLPALFFKSDEYLSWIRTKVLMDFSRSEVIFATADFPLNQVFLRHPVENRENQENQEKQKNKKER